MTVVPSYGREGDEFRMTVEPSNGREKIKHRKSLVSKRKKKSTTPSTSSPSLPPAVTTTASVGSPLPSMSSDEKLREYVHLFLANFSSQSGSVGSNPSLSALLVVPQPPPPRCGGGLLGA